MMSFTAVCIWTASLLSVCVWVTAVFDYRELVHRYGNVYRRNAISLLLRIFWPIGLIYVIFLFFQTIYSLFKIAITGKDE